MLREKPRFNAKTLLSTAVLFVSSYVANLSLAFHWASWVVWALLPVILLSGLTLVLPMLKAVKQQDRAARSGRSLGGTRFSRMLGNAVVAEPIVAHWAETHGYQVHPSSTSSRFVYMRVPLGMMPIFVAIENVDQVTKLEAWIVAPTGREEALTSGFSIRIPNWIGVSNVNKLLAELSQPPIGVLKG